MVFLLSSRMSGMRKNSIFQYTFVFLCAFYGAAPAWSVTNSDANKDYYAVLGVSPKATQKDIKKAYGRLAMKYHPDRHTGASEETIEENKKKFNEANDAYEVLRDPKTRAEYDKARMRGKEFNFQGQRRATPDIHLEGFVEIKMKFQPVVEDPYRVLGLEEDSSDRLIKRRYEKLRDEIAQDIEKKFQKEKKGLNAVEEEFSRLRELYSAYRILSNPEWRTQYHRDGTISIEGRGFLFVDRANQEEFRMFESKRGEAFYDLEGNGEFVRETILYPDESRETFLRAHIKTSGEVFTLIAREAMELPKRLNSPTSSAASSFEQLRRQLKEIRQRVNNQWSRMQSRPGRQHSQTSTRSLDSFKPSKMDWKSLERLFPYTETDTSAFKLTSSLRRLPAESFNFFVGLGAFMFIKTSFDSVQYDGVQVDPQWGQTLMTQMSSPVGLMSLASFILAAGQMNKLLASQINWLYKDMNQYKAAVRSKVAAANAFTPEHAESIRKFEKRMGGVIKTIRWSRTAFALSAGMMVSTAMHEFFADPNIKGCWKGLQDKEARSYNFMEMCDKAYTEWVSVVRTLITTPFAAVAFRYANSKNWSASQRRIFKASTVVAAVMFISWGLTDWGKMREWLPDMVGMVLAGYSATMVTSAAGFGWRNRDKIGQFTRNQWRNRFGRSQIVSGATADQWNSFGGSSTSSEGPDGPKWKQRLDKFLNSKVGRVASKLRFANWPTWVVQGTLSVPHLIAFFGLEHYVFRPYITLPLKNYNSASDILDSQVKINSHINRDAGQIHDDTSSVNSDVQSQWFDFWEGKPEPDCSLSNPQEMGIVEIFGDLIAEAEKFNLDCPILKACYLRMKIYKENLN